VPGERSIVKAVVERKDVEAALQARRELGPEYEAEIVAGMLDRIEGRLEELLRERPLPRPLSTGSVTPLALGSIGCGVGATAIATVHHQGWVAVIAWIAIAAVNAAYARWR
jgi:hypothetical protein